MKTQSDRWVTRRAAIRYGASLLALLLVAQMHFVQAAWAKPTIAVLGLEVVDDGSSVDATSIQFAKELTDALRQRPRRSIGAYSLAPGGAKDLVELKLGLGCSPDDKGCLATMSGALGADFLLLGNITRRGSGYAVTLKLFSAASGSVERVTADIVPHQQTTGGALIDWGDKLYAQAIAASPAGTVKVLASQDSGTIRVDGEVVGTLHQGSAVLPSLAPGKHRIEVTNDSMRFADSFEVVSGKDTLVEAKMAPYSIGGSGKRSDGSAARKLFWVSAGVAVIGGGFGVYEFTKIQGFEDDKTDTIDAWNVANKDDQFATGANACTAPQAVESGVKSICDDGKRAAKFATLGAVVGGVAAASAVVFFYKGYIAPKKHKGESPTSARTGEKRIEKSWAVTPVISPDTQGVTFQLHF